MDVQHSYVVLQTESMECSGNTRGLLDMIRA